MTWEVILHLVVLITLPHGSNESVASLVIAELIQIWIRSVWTVPSLDGPDVRTHDTHNSHMWDIHWNVDRYGLVVYEWMVGQRVLLDLPNEGFFLMAWELFVSSTSAFQFGPCRNRVVSQMAATGGLLPGGECLLWWFSWLWWCTSWCRSPAGWAALSRWYVEHSGSLCGELSSPHWCSYRTRGWCSRCAQT